MIALVLNGSPATLDCHPDTPLLIALREVAGLTGTRPGCLVGLCGACTVHLDGAALGACCKPAGRVQGRAVTTIEGVLGTPLGMALLRAWTDGGASGCDRCRPGRIMAAAALLARNPEAPDDEIEAVLGEHVCECGDGAAAVEALRSAARDVAAPDAARGTEPPEGGPVDARVGIPEATPRERTNP